MFRDRESGQITRPIEAQIGEQFQAEEGHPDEPQRTVDVSINVIRKDGRPCTVVRGVDLHDGRTFEVPRAAARPCAGRAYDRRTRRAPVPWLCPSWAQMATPARSLTSALPHCAAFSSASALVRAYGRLLQVNLTHATALEPGHAYNVRVRYTLSAAEYSYGLYSYGI